MAKGLDEAYHPLALGRSFAGAMFALAVLTGAATSGCATTQSRITGLVALRGFEQELVLDRGDETLRLGGRKDVIAQLDRLVDARVRLQGAVQGDTVLVRGYELLEAPDGMVPYIGRLVVDQSGARLDEASCTWEISPRCAGGARPCRAEQGAAPVHGGVALPWLAAFPST